jgi:dihydrofolate reductase
MSKVVFSSTVSEPLSWANTQLVAGDAVEAVREMKANGSTSMRTIGSLSLCRSLLNAGLVDRFRVVVFPSSPDPAVGSGSTTAIPTLLSR